MVDKPKAILHLPWFKKDKRILHFTEIFKFVLMRCTSKGRSVVSQSESAAFL